MTSRELKVSISTSNDKIRGNRMAEGFRTLEDRTSMISSVNSSAEVEAASSSTLTSVEMASTSRDISKDSRKK